MLSDHRELSDPRRAVQMGLGLSSPLWPTFFLAAGAGVAYWAWSHWGRKTVEAAGSPPLLEGFAPPPASRATPMAEKPSPPSASEAVAEDSAPVLDENLAVQGAAVAPPKPPRKPRPDAPAAKSAEPNKTAKAATAKRAPKTVKADVAPAPPIHRRGARHS